MFFTTTAKLIRLEGILSFELGATMLRNEAFSHVDGVLLDSVSTVGIEIRYSVKCDCVLYQVQCGGLVNVVILQK